jgi:hypothetical protein
MARWPWFWPAATQRMAARWPSSGVTHITGKGDSHAYRPPRPWPAIARANSTMVAPTAGSRIGWPRPRWVLASVGALVHSNVGRMAGSAERDRKET